MTEFTSPAIKLPRCAEHACVPSVCLVLHYPTAYRDPRSIPLLVALDSLWSSQGGTQ